MSEKPILVVLGATGTQGGSILSYLLSLSPTPYTLRGITRNPLSPKSLSLSALGVEMVSANFDSPSSLSTAFADASFIFSVTDFWQSFADPTQREKALATGQGIGEICRDRETEQNRNIIDAAAGVETLQRFIFSSLPNTNRLSGGKYTHVYHFEGKGVAEEYGRDRYPELWAKTSVFYAGYYLENYFAATAKLFRPRLNKTRDTLVLALEEPAATVPLPMYSAINETGPLVHALLNSEPGKKLIAVNEWVSFHDFTTLLAQILGKGVEFVNVNPNFGMGDPDLEKDLVDMIGFGVEFGYDGGKVDKSIVEPADLQVSMAMSVKEWCEGQDWEGVLEVE